jgi:predicted phosphodiesterase
MLKRYDALWVDDAWAVSGEEQSWLERAQTRISTQLREFDRTINWLISARPSDAAAELARPERDVRLVVLDYDFKGDAYTWRDVYRALERRAIPFVLLSSFVAQADADPAFVRAGSLCLGRFQKSLDGIDQLCERVIAFFRAPPLRLLHLTDVHFDAEAIGRAQEAQHSLFASLLRFLGAEHAERPLDAVVISGDLASRNPSQDLVAARQFVSDLVNATIEAANLDRLFIVPGNHDLSWADFSSRELDKQPWRHYLDFYYAIYGSRHDLLGEVKAWDRTSRLFHLGCSRTQLAWSRALPGLSLDVIGLISPCEQATHQGRGEVDGSHLNLIKERWRNKRAYGEVRMAIMHHNLFSVLSRSSHDDSDNLLNAGGTLLTLMLHDCSLVLSGHTHAANAFSCSAAHSSGDRLASTGELTAVSAGTLGGFHGAQDRRHAFNIIEVADCDPQTNRRAIGVRTFVYESTTDQWSAGGEPYRVHGSSRG